MQSHALVGLHRFLCAALLTAVAFTAHADTAPSLPLPLQTIINNEENELRTLHRAAIAEGGRVVLWAGGDAPDQMDWLKQGFEARFPGVTLDVLVDLSKFHDLRIDAELARGKLTPDVALLQTTFDFDRWKAQGVLAHYRPVGFDAQKPGYADPEGAWITAFNFAFVPTYATFLSPAQRPTALTSFLRPPFAGRLVLTWPHDDDAVLYFYHRLIQLYGRDFLHALAQQRPRFFRGTAVPAAVVGRIPAYAGNLTGYTEPTDTSRSWIPRNEPFVVWNQRMAIFRAARHPATARLLSSYVSSAAFQSTYAGWRSRADVGTAPGLPALETVPHVDVHDFTRWMADRPGVHRLRKEMQALFGPVTGESPLRDLALLQLLGLGPDSVVAPPEPTTPPY